jgi:hypothetical protein
MNTKLSLICRTLYRRPPPPPRDRLPIIGLGKAPSCLTESIPSYLLNRDLTLTKSVTIRYENPRRLDVPDLRFVRSLTIQIKC